MKIGYARVSTGDQNLDLQLRALQAAGCDRIFEDQSSGASTKRAGLDEALRQCGVDDTLVVWKLDRLGRSLSHLIGVVQELGNKGSGFQSLSENIDTTTAGGRLVFHLMGSLAEFERALIAYASWTCGRSNAWCPDWPAKSHECRPSAACPRAPGGR
jgi:DNA invertase Pin-like site-specific DNA recombinase